MMNSNEFPEQNLPNPDDPASNDNSAHNFDPSNAVPVEPDAPDSMPTTDGGGVIPASPVEAVRMDSTPSEGDEESLIVAAADAEVEEVPHFKYDGFQLVRGQFYAHTREPAITLKAGKVSVNSICLKGLPTVDYVQILVNRDTKTLVVRPCKDTDIYSFQWCSYRARDGKRSPRQQTARILFMKICDLMEWNPDYRYKVIGKLIHANNRYLFVFNLTDTDTFICEPSEDGEKTRFSRTALYPAEWQNQFGIPFNEHQTKVQVNIFDGFTIFGIKGKSDEAPVEDFQPETESASSSQDEQQSASAEYSDDHSTQESEGDMNDPISQ